MIYYYIMASYLVSGLAVAVVTLGATRKGSLGKLESVFYVAVITLTWPVFFVLAYLELTERTKILDWNEGDE
jgi:hypothetical protein